MISFSTYVFLENLRKPNRLSITLKTQFPYAQPHLQHFATINTKLESPMLIEIHSKTRKKEEDEPLALISI